MKWLKRITGTFLTVLGTIGVVCSLAGIIAVWVIRGRVDNAVAQVFDRVDVAIGKLEVRAEGTTERISNSRDSLHQLNARVQQRVAQRKDVPATEAADIDEVERRLYAGIDRARDWIEFIHSSVELVQQVSGIIESSTMFLKDDSHTVADLAGAVQTSSEELERTGELMAEVKTHLNEIRANRDHEEHARQFTSLYSRIDASLEKVENLASEFEHSVKRVRTDISEDGTNIRDWLVVAAVIITLVLLWIAIAQVSLTKDGWQIIKGTLRPAEETAETK
jgi:methyl-accepting chemotaxis protein